MKVITHGASHASKKYEAVCSTCKCHFQFTGNEAIRGVPADSTDKLSDFTLLASCPECSNCVPSQHWRLIQG